MYLDTVVLSGFSNCGADHRLFGGVAYMIKQDMKSTLQKRNEWPARCGVLS